MIQRLQSLFLLGVTLAAVALFFMPFSEKTAPAAGDQPAVMYTLSINGVSASEPAMGWSGDLGLCIAYYKPVNHGTFSLYYIPV